ncbi:MAG: hypothetical protein AAF617_14565, partial [Bacteroidota bacterium]
ENRYLRNDSFTTENVINNDTSNSLTGIGNLNLEYTPAATEKLYYNAQILLSNSESDNFINSNITGGNNTTFQTMRDVENVSFKHYVEWHKQYKNINHKTSFVVSHMYENSKPENMWLTNNQFLSGLIPLEDDALYTINQLTEKTSNSIDALFKHYWIVNNTNHIYTNLGANLEKSSLDISERQLLSNGTSNDFSLNGFGNAIDYRFYDAYLGFEYKFKIGKLINKPGLYFHSYHLKSDQLESNYRLNRFLIEPQWNSEYRFNTSETIKFNYRYTNEFPRDQQLLERFTLQNYNTVFRGNSMLRNERFHSANLRYTSMSSYRSFLIFAFINYIRKTRTLRNTIEIDGINQFTTPLLTDNPETIIQFNGTLEKKINRFKVRFKTSLSKFNYIQTLNDITTSNDRNSQKVEINLRTSSKKWPVIGVGYGKSFSQFRGLTDSSLETDFFNFDVNINFLKHFTFETDYEFTNNTNDRDLNTKFSIANASLTYNKKSSPFLFKITAQNYLNNKEINENFFSDLLISENTTFTLPRIYMLSISYKL